MSIHNQNRLTYIDTAKGIAIFLVVLGHALTEMSGLKQFIYSFHVPAFFILYGFVAKDISKTKFSSLKDIFLNGFQRYLIPYFSMMILCGGLNVDKMFDYINVRHSMLVRYEPLASWFLPCFFLSVFIFNSTVYLCHKQSFKKNSPYLYGFFLILLFLGLHLRNKRVSDALFYWNVSFVGAGLIPVGFLIKKALQKFRFDTMSFKKLFLWELLFTLILICTAFGNVFVAMVIGRYGKIPLFLLSAISGTLFLIFLSKTLCIKYPPPVYFDVLGKKQSDYYDVSSFGIRRIEKNPPLSAYKRKKRFGHSYDNLCQYVFNLCFSVLYQ